MVYGRWHNEIRFVLKKVFGIDEISYIFWFPNRQKTTIDADLTIKSHSSVYIWNSSEKQIENTRGKRKQETGSKTKR